ncbi:MAG: GNAT family N-acetyltransferase [Candidatus Coatesbacteria bacterium]|nr:MAG: GNAT family N-acetyltransferase [Candidatus Coatesbacteria bacterium]
MGIDYFRASESDILDARELFNRIFDASASEACWRRKYFENPAGQVIAFAAREDARLVGIYPLHPALFSIFGKETLIYQSADTMTDPAYRRKGVYGSLRKRAHEWLVGEGVPFTYGFPNIVSLAANRRAGFELVGRLTRWIKPLPAGESEPLRKALNSVYHGFSSMLNPPRDVKPAEKIDRFDERVDAVWTAVKNERLIAGVRSGSLLEWRYGHDEAVAAWISNPPKPDGYVIAEKTPKGVWIRDLIADGFNRGAVYSLLRAVVEHAVGAGSRHVVFPHLSGAYRGRLLRTGFIPAPGGAPVVVFARANRSREWSRAVNWYVSDADRDVECR